MRRTLPAALLLVAAPAFAKSYPPAGEASATAVAEVPLYAGLVPSDPYWYVEVQAGEARALLRLTTEGNAVELTEGAVGKLGGKVSGKEGRKHATIDTLSLGSATFARVKVKVIDGVDSGGQPVDGRVSLAAFPELAWAILPSRGVLRVGPKDAAAEVLGDLAGAEGFPAADLRARKDIRARVGRDRHRVTPAVFVVPATWSGVEHRAAWILDGETHLAREAEGLPGFALEGSDKKPLALPPAPTRPRGPAADEWRAVGVAGSTVDTWVDRGGEGLVYLAPATVGATVGNDVARHYDQGYDPGGNALKLRPASTVRTASYAETYEAALRKALEPGPAAEGAEAPGADAAKEARLGALGPLAGWLESQGRWADALPLRQELADARADDCANWLALGETRLAAGDATGAAEAFGKADALYLPWSRLPLEERQALKADYDKAKARKRDWTGQVPQSHACHVAVGRLAQARVLAGDLGAVDGLYPVRLDLDPGLPRAAGCAWLIAGKKDQAQAAFLQAIQLAGIAGDDADARLGMFLVRGADGAAQLRPEAFADPAVVEAFAAAHRSRPGGAVAALQALADADPGNVTLLAALAREQGAAGDTAAADRSLAAAGALVERRLAMEPGAAGALADAALWHLAAGRTAEAEDAARRATAAAPADPRGWSVLATVAEAAGRAEDARAHRARAAALAPTNPLYAALARR